jgi:hypothetical protein
MIGSLLLLPPLLSALPNFLPVLLHHQSLWNIVLGKIFWLLSQVWWLNSSYSGGGGREDKIQ